MNVLRSALTIGLAAPLMLTPVITPVWAAPGPITPDVTTVKVELEGVAKAAVSAAPDAIATPTPTATTHSSEPAVPSASEPTGEQPAPTETAPTEPAPGGAPAPTSAPAAEAEITLVTPTIHSDTFAGVGATWDPAEEVDSIVIEARVNSSDGWGNWAEVPIGDEGPDPDSEEGQRVLPGTGLLWVGDSEDVQLRVSGAVHDLPAQLDLSLIDSRRPSAGGLAAQPAATAHADTAYPRIIARSQWGADESRKTCNPGVSSTIKAAVVHHTATVNTYATPADAMRYINMIYGWHLERHFCDIGYNMIVDKWGNIYEGRAGGVNRAIVGAHAGGYNTDTVGVSMLGDFSAKARVAPTAAQRSAVAEVIGWKLSMYGRDPQGMTQLVSRDDARTNPKYPPGTLVTVPVVLGHRDVNYTECPGDYALSSMNVIRAEAASRIPNASFVRALYADMMGRPADNDGVALWTSNLAARGWDRRMVSRGFSTSDEYRMLSIDQAYLQVLGRYPDGGGKQTWLGALRNGSVRIDNLRPTLMASEEFYLRGGSSDAAFVDNIYRASLGRGADSSEVQFWADIRRRQGPAAVISSVWGSREAGMRRVDQGYRYYLGRQAGRSEQEYWVPVVMGSGDEQLREELVVSYEYFLRSGDRFR